MQATFKNVCGSSDAKKASSMQFPFSQLQGSNFVLAMMIDSCFWKLPYIFPFFELNTSSYPAALNMLQTDLSKEENLAMESFQQLLIKGLCSCREKKCFHEDSPKKETGKGLGGEDEI